MSLYTTQICKFDFIAIEEIEWFESEEIMPRKQLTDLDENVKYAKMFTCGDLEIGYVNNVISNFSANGINNAAELAEKEHSDLVTGKYEGNLCCYMYKYIAFVLKLNIQCFLLKLSYEFLYAIKLLDKIYIILINYLN